MLFEFLIVSVKVAKLIWKDISVRDEIKVLFTEFLLHSYHIKAQPVLASDLVTLREVVDLLVFVKPFVEVRLAARRTPEHIPLMRLCMTETIILKHRSH